MQEKNNIYKKFQSFNNFKDINNLNKNNIEEKIFKTYEEFKLKLSSYIKSKDLDILKKIILDLKSPKNDKTNFSLKPNSIAEINALENVDILK